MLVWAIAAAACSPGMGDVASARAQTPRAVYVADTPTLIADPAARARLTAAIATNTYTEVIPYKLGPLLGSVTSRAALAGWIMEIQGAGGAVTAPIAGTDRIEAIAKLVAEQSVHLDGLITELEFWNRDDRAVAFAEMLALLDAMRAHTTDWAAPRKPLIITAYLGYPSADEAAQLAGRVDRVLLNYSVRSPTDPWSSGSRRMVSLRRRFETFARLGVPIWPIFYSTGEVDMQTTLRAKGIVATEAAFRDGLASHPDLARTPLPGFAYFTFEAMP